MEKILEIIDQRTLLEKDFKIYGTIDNPLFLARDVADWIENNQPTQMVELVDEDEKLKCLVNTSGQNRNMWFLTEDGFYEILMQSRKPIAKKFKKEVKTILKQIRKTGGYIPIDESEDDETFLAKAFLVAQRTIAKKDELLKAKDTVIKEKTIELDQKNRFINQIAISENSLLVREVAKIASKSDVIIGEKRLWAKLREWGLIFKNTTEPKQIGIDKGYFEVSEGTKEAKGKVFTYRTTRVTGKGQAYIIEKLLVEL